jgi:hypothetical protein
VNFQAKTHTSIRQAFVDGGEVCIHIPQQSMMADWLNKQPLIG